MSYVGEHQALQAQLLSQGIVKGHKHPQSDGFRMKILYLGSVSHGMTKDYEEALRLCEQSYAVACRLRGPGDHMRHGIGLCLAYCLAYTGDSKEARKLSDALIDEKPLLSQN